MDLETLRTLSTVFYTLAGVSFFVAVLLFFILDIPKVFGMVTGLSAARGIKKYQSKMKEENKPVENTASMLMQNDTSKNLKGKAQMTEKLHTVILNPSSDSAPANNEVPLPVEDPDAEFLIIQELSFTSSAEIVE